MSAERYRAWRFIHPDLDQPYKSAGLQITARGGIDMVAGDPSVRQAIFLLLSTIPGERVMRPEYGCHLQRLVFESNDGTTAGLAIHYVRRALERWEPRIEIVQLDAGQPAEQPELLVIVLDYRVKATQNIEQLAFAVNLTGEEA